MVNTQISLFILSTLQRGKCHERHEKKKKIRCVKKKVRWIIELSLAPSPAIEIRTEDETDRGRVEKKILIHNTTRFVVKAVVRAHHRARLQLSALF